MFWSINIGQVLIFIGLCVVGFGLFAIGEAIENACNTGINRADAITSRVISSGHDIADRAFLHGHQIADQLRPVRTGIASRGHWNGRSENVKRT
jgi:hypothetical protein